MALVLIPERSGAPGMCCGRGIWFPMAGVNPTPQVEAFLDFLCGEMVRRAKVKAERPLTRDIDCEQTK